MHLRGNELSLNTFIDGVSFYDNPHQLFTPGLSPDIIQSVNVLTGGFPAEFGNRFGGILDIVTRSGFDANGHGSATIGASTFLRNNISFDYGGHTPHFGYFFYGQGFESLRFLNTPEPTLLHDKGYGARSFAQFDYHLGNDSFKVALTGDGTNFELPNTTEDALRDRDFFQRNREQTAVLSWDHIFSSSSALSTSFYECFAGARLLPTSDPFSIQAGGLHNDLTFGAKADYSLFAGSRHSIKAGLDLMVLRIREDFFFDPRDNEVEIEAFDFRGRRTGVQGSAYFQDKFQITHNFTANLGPPCVRKGLTYRERRSGFFATTQLEYGSGTPAALHVAEGDEALVRLPDHFVANFYFSIDLPFKEKEKINLQFNVENATNRVFQIAKESEFTPVQFSPPRFISGSVKIYF